MDYFHNLLPVQERWAAQVELAYADIPAEQAKVVAVANPRVKFYAYVMAETLIDVTTIPPIHY
jgi:hypothetical protein